MKRLRVTMENSEEAARELVEELFDKNLKIFSWFMDGSKRTQETRKLERRVLSGFTMDNGRVTIRLTPSRKIFWDVSKEEVEIVYLEGGDVEIHRKIGMDKELIRLIVS